ncbi:MAG: hypothetical protein ACXWB2_05125 [Acidimicrobiales bacterium]
MKVASVRTLAVVGVAALVTLGSVSPASARPRPVQAVYLDAYSTTSTTDEQGSTSFTTDGEVSVRLHGALLPATVTAVLTPDDGTLPDSESCEPASASITVTGANRVAMQLVGTGTVCGAYPQEPTSIVTQVFTGRYDVVEARRAKVRGTDGFFEIRLADDGSASAFAIDT